METRKLLGNILAVMITLMILATVGALTWSNQQRLDVPMLWNGAVGSDGNVYVILGDTLHVETLRGESVERIPLEALGIREFNGDLLPLPGGEFILAAGTLDKMTIEQGIRRFKREARADGDPVDFLQRCNFETRQCTVLDGDDSGTPVFRPGRAFGLDAGIGNTILAADATGHKVHVLAADGRILDTIDSGFEFPNELRRSGDGEALVVDTNHHRLVHYEISESGFGPEIRERSILDWPGVEGLQRFPFAWEKTPDGTEWLLVAGSDMGHAILLRIEGEDVTQLPLPENADPVDFVALDDRLLVLDQGVDRMLAFSLDGEPLGDFGSDGLQAELERNAGQRAHFELLTRISQGFLVLIAVLAVPIGGFMLYRRYRSGEADNTESVSLDNAEAVQSGSLAAADTRSSLERLAGRYSFARSFSALDAGDAFRINMLIGILIVVALASLVAMNLEEIRGTDLRDMIDAFGEDSLYFFVFLGVSLASIYIQHKERLVVDRSGIHYTSWLPPLLEMLQPSWTLEWDDIDDIRLTHAGNGAQPQSWHLVVQPRQGRPRRIRAFQWRLIGHREAGLLAKDLTRLKKETIRNAIRKRMLYRVLATQMQRLRENGS